MEELLSPTKKLKNIKSKALVGALLFSAISSFSQETFNKRYNLGLTGFFGQIEFSDNGYLVVGTRVPEGATVYQENLIILKFDLNGNVLNQNSYGGDGEIIQPFPGTSHLSFDQSTLLSANWHIEPGNNNRCTVFAIDENLEINTFGSYYSPYYWDNPKDFNQSFAVPLDFQIVPAGEIYLTCGIFKQDTGNDFVVWKILPDGQQEWEYIYATSAEPDACYSLVAQQDGVVLGVISGGVDFQSAIRRLIKLNPVGEETWNHQINSTSIGAFFAMLPIGDAFIVGTSSLQGVGGVPMVFSLDTLGQIGWSEFPEVDYSDVVWAQTARKLTQTTDGNIVVGANHFVPDLVLGGAEREEAWIIKLTPAGEQIWERKYYFDEGECLINKINDLKTTPDGGVVFCGESRVCTTPNGPDQQGWVVKLDSCGCLVPGCDPGCIIDNVAEQSRAKEALMVVGPNPATGSEFYVHVRTQAAGNLRIHDLQGREVKNIRLRGEGTYAVGCCEWATGVYVVSLEADGRVLETVKVVKE